MVDVAGENGNGESDEDGECDSGVLTSEAILIGRGTCDDGRGIGTPFVLLIEWTESCVVEVCGDEDAEFEDDL